MQARDIDRMLRRLDPAQLAAAIEDFTALARRHSAGLAAIGFDVSSLDAASGLPLHPAARTALVEALDQGWADPARRYHDARRARQWSWGFGGSYALLAGASLAIAPNIKDGAVDIYVGAGSAGVGLGLAILTVSLAFNLLGDGLRDALDPKDH